MDDEPAVPARLETIVGTATVHGTDATDEQLHELGAQVHRRCPVANMVTMSGCELKIEWKKAET